MTGGKIKFDMKTTRLAIVLLVLLTGSSCRLLRLPEQDMFDQTTLRKVFAAVKEKSIGKESLFEIEITNNEVYFANYTQRFVYARSSLSQAKAKSTGDAKPFRLAEAEVFDLDQARAKVLEFAKKNPYLKNPGISRIVITNQLTSRDDNLVSNIDKWHEAIRCEFYLADVDTQAQYTTNLQGEIVDVATTNVKPRLKFFDAAQMKKSLAEIKLLFGGKLFVSDLDIHIENFYFTARDPKNADELNSYRFDSQELLNANKSIWQKTPQEKKREAEIRRETPDSFSLSPEPVFFDVDEIDLSLIPVVIQKTLANSKTSNAAITGIRISVPLDRFKKTTEIEWRVETIGDRSEKETVIFDRQGNLKSE